MKLVAVTACPTGIAQSQMAAENLRQAVEGTPHELRVEVRGAMGTEAELTRAEIAAADAAILAADTAVEADRFGDTPTVRVPVAEAVTDASELVTQVCEQTTKPDGAGRVDASGADEHGAGSANGTDSDPGQQRGGAPDSGRKSSPSLPVRIIRRLFG